MNRLAELRDVPYTQPGDAARVLDLFVPPPDRQSGILVVLFHGGGFDKGDKSGWHQVARHLAELGHACATPTYRRVPKWVFPTQVQDARQAIAFLLTCGRTLGAEFDRWVTLGSSAGAYLALILATISPDDLLLSGDGWPTLDTRPHAAIGYCPVLHLYPYVMPPDAEQRPELYRQANIVERFTGAEPPMLLVHGTSDDLISIDDSRQAVQRLKQLGGDASLVELLGVGHGFGYGTTSPAQQQTLTHVESFIDRVCGHPDVRR
jgi:acetyl esterase/lipase